MLKLENKQVLVIGLDSRGWAACDLLCRSGAHVTAVDSAETDELREEAGKLRAMGIQVVLGVSTMPEWDFDLAVLGSAAGQNARLAQAAANNGARLISELELGFQQSKCLCIAVAGTNGKGTTAELIERLLANNHRKTLLCGQRSRPICSVVEQTKDLDFLILQVSANQLETNELFRPAVSVFVNLSPAALARHASGRGYVRGKPGVFPHPESFDLAK